MENSDLDVLSRVAATGLHEWGLYNTLLAIGETTVNFTKYAALLGITDKTIRKYFAKLEAVGLIRMDGNTVIFTERLVFTGSYISYNVNVNNDINNMEPVKTETVKPAKSGGTLAYWCAAYLSRYGIKYAAGNWAIEQRNAKLLDTRHGDRIRPIIDVVMRLYETRWYSQRYPRPTLGAMVSWMAAQADGFVPAVLPPQTGAAGGDVTPDITELSEFDDKFGLGGVTVGE